MNLKKNFAKNAHLLTAATCFLGVLTASANDPQVLLKDDFSDGNYSENPAWKSSKTEGPWVLKHEGGVSAFQPTGEFAWDALRTADFAPISDGQFELSFDVRFNSEERSGANRIYVILSDSNNDFAGYQLDIPQGTTNDATIAAQNPSGRKPFAFLLNPAVFPPGEFVKVKWARRADGQTSVTIGGEEYFSGTDSTYSIFDRLMIGSVGSAERRGEFTQAFSNIELKASPSSK